MMKIKLSDGMANIFFVIYLRLRYTKDNIIFFLLFPIFFLLTYFCLISF